MTVEQKDLVLLPYPFTDLENSKVRPALVVSNEVFNKKSRDRIMIPLTTVLNDAPYSIFITQESLQFGKLVKPSRIRVDKVFSIEQGKILLKIGRLKDSVFDKVRAELLKVF